MKKSRRRDVDIFNLSFLDVISCGFGAVILLLVIALALEPTTVEKITRDLRGIITVRNEARQEHNDESRKLTEALTAKRKTLAAIAQQIEALDRRLGQAKTEENAVISSVAKQDRLEKELQSVRQRLTEEMKRLLRRPVYRPPREEAVIGGIPVDSEYIIFIIDTSGSMQKMAWPLVVRKVQEVLRVHPRVKGIQVLNDMGRYMFTSYSGRWIPDTPVRRAAVVRVLRAWRTFSNSSPVEGVVTAIRHFYKEDKRISLYVFGDDFTGRNINDVIKEVARINRPDARGRPRVRIHAFGFPVQFLSSKRQENLTRFAHLMRVLAERNAGSFVGLNGLR
jgi:hypothetical protein